MGFLLCRYAFVIIKNICPLYEQRTHSCVPPESQPPYIVNPVLRTLFDHTFYGFTGVITHAGEHSKSL